jgi:hypothetical protein
MVSLLAWRALTQPPHHGANADGIVAGFNATTTRTSAPDIGVMQCWFAQQICFAASAEKVGRIGQIAAANCQHRLRFFFSHGGRQNSRLQCRFVRNQIFPNARAAERPPARNGEDSARVEIERQARRLAALLGGSWGPSRSGHPPHPLNKILYSSSTFVCCRPT